MACDMAHLLMVWVAAVAAAGGEGGAVMWGAPIETDAESGAAIYCLGADPRPADNIYGEQPYGDASGRRIAIRYYTQDDRPGGISLFDLIDGSLHQVLSGKPPFPAFHAWGEWLYYHQRINDQLTLRRCNYLTLQIDDVAPLPDRGRYSYGTVSPDQRWYAVSVYDPDNTARVWLLDLHSGEWRLLLYKPDYLAKHEQFSLDGRNKVLIQLNHMPKVEQVLLAELSLDGTETLLPADRPHTPRPTGHEAWVGDTDRVFYSTAADPDSRGNLWVGRAGEAPTLVNTDGKRFGHVSVSRCGRYWVGDTGEEGIPLYIGNFATGRARRAVFSRTVYDDKQWSHAHPFLTADNRWLIYASTRGGHAQVYGARLADGWLDQL